MTTNLPEHVLVNILVKLPVNFLLRCRCVCKSWCSLISSTLFISAHHNHNTAAGDRRTVIVRRCDPLTGNIRYTLHSDDESFTEIAEFDYPSPNPKNTLRILGSVNGLMCMLSDDSTLMLWNPTIRKSLILPNPTVRLIGQSCPIFGFGFDSFTNDYKVVRVVCGSSGTCVEIYRLSTRSWSRIDLGGDVSIALPSLFPRQIYLNGLVHWLGSNSTIVGFDLRSETFRVMNLPGHLEGKRMEDVAIAAWCGLLALFELEDSKKISLWVMKKYDVVESWTRECVISFPSIPSRVRSIRSDGKILVEDIFGFLILFDPVTQVISDLMFPGLGDDAAFHMKSYSESLVLLDVRDEKLDLGKQDAQGVVDNGQIRSYTRWSDEEEEILVRAWLSVSKDVHKKTDDRRVDSFWQQVEANFEKHRQGGSKRSWNQLKQHWYIINRAASKFQKCYKDEKRQCQMHIGRMAESDIILNAFQAYKDEEKRHFKYKQAWLLLKDEPKWTACEGCDEGSSKRRKVLESGAYTSSSNAGTSDADDSEASKVCPVKKKGKAKVEVSIKNQS